MTDYRALVTAGHSGLKAKQIELDALRGDHAAQCYIRHIRRVLGARADD